MPRTYTMKRRYRPRWAFTRHWCWLFGHRWFNFGTWKNGPALACLFHSNQAHSYPEWDSTVGTAE